MRDTAPSGRLDERAMERDAPLRAFVDGHHEHAVALGERSLELAWLPVVGDDDFGTGDLRRPSRVADNEPYRFASLSELLGHEPADVPG